MDRVSPPALRGSLLGTVLRLLNPLVRLLLRSPVDWPLSRWFAILAWTGRTSGQRYSTPVSYVREDDSVWVTTGDRWWRNLIKGAPVVVRVAGHWRDATGVAITHPRDAALAHERLFRAHRWFRWLSGIPGDRTGGPDPAALERSIAAGRVLVRIDILRDQDGASGVAPDARQLTEIPRA